MHFNFSILAIHIKNNYVIYFPVYPFLKNSTIKYCNEFIEGKDSAKIGKSKCRRCSYAVWHCEVCCNNNMYINQIDTNRHKCRYYSLSSNQINSSMNNSTILEV